jgi:50S ribosomal subunit-associated GTPase HflX
MVGNKSDIVDREIAKNEIEEYAERNKYPFIEVSAKTGNNIHLLFRRLSERLIDNKNGVNKEPSQITSIPNKAPPPNTSKQNNISITKK